MISQKKTPHRNTYTDGYFDILVKTGVNSITINNTDLQQGQMSSELKWKAGKWVHLSHADFIVTNSPHSIHRYLQF